MDEQLKTASLDSAQRQAVTTLAGPLLVLAGAGTGKTRVVTYRIAQLIRSGVAGGRILAVTFTNKAAGEMHQRAAGLLGKRLRPEQTPQISTFHSLCVRVLRRHITRLGYPAEFAIYDAGDQASVARRALGEVPAAGAMMRARDLVGWIGRWKTRSVRPRDAAAAAQSDQEHLAAAAYRRYQKALYLAGAVDFDDLLLCTEDLLDGFPDVLAAEAGRFDHLLIDEYQDTNAAQYRIVRALASGHRNLCVVGDDDQSIYGWRGAEVAHILRFQRDWPDARVVRLEENYRSTQAILSMANRLIRCNRTRHDKTLRAARHDGQAPRILQCADEAAEASQIVAEIGRQISNRQAQPGDFAILYRTNEQPRPFEQELRRARLPYAIIGGTSFFDRTEVRDVLAYLRVLAYPRDKISLSRIINTPARGISPRVVELLAAESIASSRTLWDVIASDTASRAGPKAAEAVARFRALIEGYRRRLGHEPLADLVADLVQAIGYQQYIHAQHDEPAQQLARWNSVQQVINALADYSRNRSQPALSNFLDEVALDDGNDRGSREKQLPASTILLLTLHSAKGLEFPHVYLVGMEEGLLPHRRAIEDGSSIDEERRLCYVGVTRAQNQLTLSLALARNKWGKLRPTVASRFLWELTGKTPPSQRPPSAPGPKQPVRTGRSK